MEMGASDLVSADNLNDNVESSNYLCKAQFPCSLMNSPVVMIYSLAEATVPYNLLIFKTGATAKEHCGTKLRGCHLVLSDNVYKKSHPQIILCKEIALPSLINLPLSPLVPLCGLAIVCKKNITYLFSKQMLYNPRTICHGNGRK